MTFEQFFDAWIENIIGKKQQRFYDSFIGGAAKNGGSNVFSSTEASDSGSG